MDAVIDFLNPLTAYHWIAIGLILFGIEMAIGTFDLLWVSVAAFATAVFGGLAPDAIAGWQGQIGFFALTSVVLIILGRTVFAGLRRVANVHPTLNKRMDSLIGARGVATADFSAGFGRVKLGDTVWSAEIIEGVGQVREGDAIIVESTKSTRVRVKPAT